MAKKNENTPMEEVAKQVVDSTSVFDLRINYREDGEYLIHAKILNKATPNQTLNTKYSALSKDNKRLVDQFCAMLNSLVE
jgi:hypothetical protein